MLCCASQFQLLTKFAEGFDDDLKHPKVHFGSIVVSLPRGGGWLLCIFVSGAAYHQCMWPYNSIILIALLDLGGSVCTYLQCLCEAMLELFFLNTVRNICVLSAMKGLYQYPSGWGCLMYYLCQFYGDRE